MLSTHPPSRRNRALRSSTLEALPLHLVLCSLMLPPIIRRNEAYFTLGIAYCSLSHMSYARELSDKLLHSVSSQFLLG